MAADAVSATRLHPDAFVYTTSTADGAAVIAVHYQPTAATPGSIGEDSTLLGYLASCPGPEGIEEYRVTSDPPDHPQRPWYSGFPSRRAAALFLPGAYTSLPGRDTASSERRPPPAQATPARRIDKIEFTTPATIGRAIAALSDLSANAGPDSLLRVGGTTADREHPDGARVTSVATDRPADY